MKSIFLLGWRRMSFFALAFGFGVLAVGSARAGSLLEGVSQTVGHEKPTLALGVNRIEDRLRSAVAATAPGWDFLRGRWLIVEAEAFLEEADGEWGVSGLDVKLVPVTASIDDGSELRFGRMEWVRDRVLGLEDVFTFKPIEFWGRGDLLEAEGIFTTFSASILGYRRVSYTKEPPDSGPSETEPFAVAMGFEFGKTFASPSTPAVRLVLLGAEGDAGDYLFTHFYAKTLIALTRTWGVVSQAGRRALVPKPGGQETGSYATVALRFARP